ncbi:MAG TPA: UDP-N-acetylmuramoyl-L-alanyl-D-glutamate--2,6-diaminopimelate ligase [Verrucomicrobiales bacterium]|nr:UDP-N-acetylmuramoyl-L-alanyl-D-glutamate--2,6-diaminopimelate ligase [Verrucomicrobiales bacterium]
MQLRQLIQSFPTQEVEGALDREVTGLAYDSRRVTAGTVFVALRGQRTDGHQFINDAIDRGAVAVICERNGFSSARATKIVVSDAREALARAATAFHGNPSAKLKVIGVTGTNGKTTVAFMVKALMDAAGIPTGLLGTIRYEIGDRVIPAARTTPEALEIQQMLSQMVRAGCQACVMEVSSHALDQKRTLGVEFDVAIFTNLTQDHLDYHGTMDGYFAAKMKLFTALQHGVKRGAAVINIDDAYGERLRLQTEVAVKLTYGLGEAAQLRATNLRLDRNQTSFQVAIAGQSVSCQLPLIGRYNIYNALAALGAGLMLNVEVPTLRRALRELSPVPGRLERITRDEEFSVFVDYAHTDDALAQVLETLREVTPGRLLLVFGCGGSRDTGKRAKMGAVAARLADETIITSDNPRREPPAAIAAEIEQGYRAIREDGYQVELDRQRAIDAIIERAGAGDTVLIAGKGHETYQEFEDTVVPFDDRIIAREALDALSVRRRQGGGRRLDCLLV